MDTFMIKDFEINVGMLSYNRKRQKTLRDNTPVP